MTIDTNKARELAQALKHYAGTRSNGEAKTEVDAAALLLALADAHDRMAKALERIRNEPYTSTADARLIAHRAIDAAMGADQRGKK